MRTAPCSPLVRSALVDEGYHGQVLCGSSADVARVVADVERFLNVRGVNTGKA